MLPSARAAELTKCVKPDGTIYVGIAPPSDCAIRATEKAADSDTGTSWKPGTFAPPRPRKVKKEDSDAEAAVEREIRRKRSVPALAIQRMEIRSYINGLFFEGTIANGADFPVYRSQICIDDGRICRALAPPTLQPGAQATFAIGVPNWNSPANYQITWDVVP